MDNKREGTNGRKEGEDVGKFDGQGNECKRAWMTGSPKVISSPLVSPTATINMTPLGPFDVDVAATFRVPLTTVGDLHMLINDIKAGKHDDLLSGMTNDDRMETMDALGTICNSIEADNPIVRSVNINTKSTSYAKAAGSRAKDQLKVKFNFRPLVADPVFDGVNISIPCKFVEKVSTRFEHTLYGYFIRKRMVFSVVEYYARNNWAKHGLKRIMMNSKGFFFFKFDSPASLEAVLEGGPWLIRKSPIILKKWSMDTRLLKEELTRIPYGLNCMMFLFKYLKRTILANLVDVVTIGVPSLTGDDFTKETIRVEYEWRPPRCDICKIFGHVHDHYPKKVVSPPIVITLNVVTPTVEKANDGFQKVVTTRRRKLNPSLLMVNTGKSTNNDNITSSNSFSALNVEDEDVENVNKQNQKNPLGLFLRSNKRREGQRIENDEL
nr:zinc knuckle CX2CX4HX4C [Tanacetum cinerariifolium]